jgi:hypothetical protein
LNRQCVIRLELFPPAVCLRKFGLSQECVVDCLRRLFVPRLKHLIDKELRSATDLMSSSRQPIIMLSKAQPESHPSSREEEGIFVSSHGSPRKRDENESEEEEDRAELEDGSLQENHPLFHDAASHILSYEDNALSPYLVSESENDSEVFDTDEEGVSHHQELGDNDLEGGTSLRASKDHDRTIKRESGPRQEETREIQNTSIKEIDDDAALSFQFDPHGEWCEFSLNVSCRPS